MLDVLLGSTYPAEVNKRLRSARRNYLCCRQPPQRSQFLGFARERAGSADGFRELEQLRVRLAALFEGEATYTRLLELFDILIQFGGRGELRRLLSLPLELRRLLVTAREEQSLARRGRAARLPSRRPGFTLP